MDYLAPRFPPNPLPVPPWRRFKPAGTVSYAIFTDTSPLRHVRNPGTTTQAQKAGKRFEKKLLSKLEGRKEQFIKAPWIEFSSGAEKRWCQPDGLLFTSKGLVIVEAKICHTTDAYWQLRLLYEPVMRKIQPEGLIHLCEITRSFDPAVRMPEEMVLFFDLDEMIRQLPSVPRKEINVLQWKL